MVGKNIYLNSKERNMIWQALYSTHASGQYNNEQKKLMNKIMNKVKT